MSYIATQMVLAGCVIAVLGAIKLWQIRRIAKKVRQIRPGQSWVQREDDPFQAVLDRCTVQEVKGGWVKAQRDGYGIKQPGARFVTEWELEEDKLEKEYGR